MEQDQDGRLAFHGWNVGPRNGSMKLRNYSHSLLPAIVAFLSLFLHSRSLAYQFTEDVLKGSFWRTFPIPLKLQLSRENSKFKITEEALIEAMDEWQRHAPVSLWSYKGGPEATTVANVVRWSSNFEKETGYSAHSTMAVTIRYSTPPLIQRTEIVINGQYFGLEDVDSLKMVLVHELGHTIGLDHSSDLGSIMYRSLSLGSTSNSSLSVDDIVGLEQVMLFHSQKQSEPIQLEQNRSSTNLLDGIASCGQNNLDTSSISPAESAKLKIQKLLAWFVSLFLGALTILSLIYTRLFLLKLTKKHFKSRNI